MAGTAITTGVVVVVRGATFVGTRGDGVPEGVLDILTVSEPRDQCAEEAVAGADRADRLDRDRRGTQDLVPGDEHGAEMTHGQCNDGNLAAVDQRPRSGLPLGRVRRLMPGEFAHLDRQTRTDDKVIDDRGLTRIDFAPQLRYPFKRWPFLTVNSTVSWRETYYTRSLDPTDTRGWVTRAARPGRIIVRPNIAISTSATVLP